jgi:hypothetical protein
MFLSDFLVVEPCSNRIFRGGYSYGKSPCFSREAFFRSVDVECGGYIFAVFNMAVVLE